MLPLTYRIDISYLNAYFIALERWLREWRIAINKSMAILFSPPRRRIPNPRGLMFLGEGGEIQWVETARYLG